MVKEKNKTTKDTKTNNKKHIIITGAFCLLVGLGCMSMQSYQNNNIDVFKDELQVEIGDSIPVNTLFDQPSEKEKLNNISMWFENTNIVDADIAKQYVVDFADDGYQEELKTTADGTQYLPVGDYDIKIKFVGEQGEKYDKYIGEKSATLNIVDTTAPKVESNELTLPVHSDLTKQETWKDLEVSEYSEYTVKLSNTSDKKLSQETGDKKVDIIVEDEYGNEVTENIQLKIVEESQTEEKSQDATSTKETVESQNTTENKAAETSSGTSTSTSTNAAGSSSSSVSNGSQTSNSGSTSGSSTGTAPAPVPTPEPEPEPAPACDPVPAGVFYSYQEARLAAQAVLDNMLMTGQMDNGRYYIYTYVTNCGVTYYTYEVAPF